MSLPLRRYDLTFFYKKNAGIFSKKVVSFTLMFANFIQKLLPPKTIYRKFRKTPHDQFIDLIYLSVDQQKIKGVTFPGFPKKSLQTGMVGSYGKNTLYEPKNLYLQIHKVAEQQKLRFTPETKVLDFGCGFGRMYRFFMKDVAPGNLIGTDATKDFYKICINTFPQKESRFILNDPFPPLPFDENTFNIVYLYSVFTHLSEKCFLAWLKEFHRIIKPNGLLFFTLRQKSFLEDLATQTRDFDSEPINAYMEKLRGQFVGPAVLEKYDNGEFIFFPNGGGRILDSSFYGDTVIPPKYLENVLKKDPLFECVENFDEPATLPQAFVALKIKK